MRVLLLGCLVAAILVQTPAGAAAVHDVRGVVVDSSGAVIPGATVMLTTAGAATAIDHERRAREIHIRQRARRPRDAEGRARRFHPGHA